MLCKEYTNILEIFIFNKERTDVNMKNNTRKEKNNGCIKNEIDV